MWPTAAPLRRAQSSRVSRTAAEAVTADRRCDPHPLDLGRRVAIELDRPATDGLPVEIRDEEVARRGPDLVRKRRRADVRVKPALRATVELGHILREAALSVGMLWIGRPDLDARGAEQTLHLAHRGDEPLALSRAQGRQQRPGELSERASRVARSRRPAAVRRATRIRRSRALGPRVISRSASRARGAAC